MFHCLVHKFLLLVFGTGALHFSSVPQRQRNTNRHKHPTTNLIEGYAYT